MTELQDQELMFHRGQYSTLGAEQRDTLKRLQMLTGSLSSVAAQVLHGVQPKDESEPINVTAQIEMGRALLTDIDACVLRLADLAKQRAELKPLAWGKR